MFSSKTLNEKKNDIYSTESNENYCHLFKTTVYSDEDAAHKQQFSIIGDLLIAVSTFVNDTYSPPRNLTKSFFRS